MTLEGASIPNTGFKLRIYPNKKQQKQIWQNISASRKAYNFARNINIEEYRKWQEVQRKYKEELKAQNLSEEQINSKMTIFNRENKKNYVSDEITLRNMFNKEKRENPEFSWILEADSTITDAIYFNYKTALKQFRAKGNYERMSTKIKKEIAQGSKKKYSYPESYGFPRNKSYKKQKSYRTSIPMNHIDLLSHKIYLNKIGWVRTAPNQEFPALDSSRKTVQSPVVSTDGLRYWVSFQYYRETKPLDIPQTDLLGIDLGISGNVAILSTGEVIPNSARDPKVMKWTQEIKNLQKKKDKLMNKGKSVVFRPYILTSEELALIPSKERGKKLAELAKIRNSLSTWQTRDIDKKIKLRYCKINDRRDYLLKKACSDIVKKNPKGIIFENLNVKEMQQGEHSKNVQKAAISKFKTTLINFATKYEIPVREVDRYFASSQKCSADGCDGVNENMKDLSIRTFVCPKCGLTIDRDLNAAINLKKAWDSAEEIKLDTDK